MKSHQKGFTIIELIVVIAIIAVLAGIVTSGVSAYYTKAKISRAKTDVQNMEKAMLLLRGQYGNYFYANAPIAPPFMLADYAPVNIMGDQSGEPYVLDSNNNKHSLSEVYKLNWDTYNATYYSPTAYYEIILMKTNMDPDVNEFDCGYIRLSDDSGQIGTKCILDDYPIACTGFCQDSGIFIK